MVAYQLARIKLWRAFPPVAALVLLFSMHAFAQVTSATIAERAKAPSNSIPLAATATVDNCLAVEAVLLPKKPTAMLFSGYVAEHFAVVKTTISNHCANQQFILHNIYFDYRDWALSGVYSGPVPCTSAMTRASLQEQARPASKAGNVPGAPTEPVAEQQADSASKAKEPTSLGKSQSNAQSLGQTDCDPWVRSSTAGQVATVGALDVQEEVTQDSVFSKRNLIINGLTLVGQVAGGYAFIGSSSWVQGIGAYNSAFVPNMAKFWPDRRIDQEKFLLALGYRTDQTTVIAKQDHGSYYAFFPIATFLTPTLRKLFLDDPAVFLNPAEAWFEQGALQENGQTKHAKGELASLRNMLFILAQQIDASVTPAKLLTNLSAKCTEDSVPSSCAICGTNPQSSESEVDDAADRAAREKFEGCRNQVFAEKTLFRKASLNAAKIAVRGVMTIDVNSLEPTIGNVSFDGEEKGAAQWKVGTAKAPGTAATRETDAKVSNSDKKSVSDKKQKTATSTSGNDSSDVKTASDSSAAPPDSHNLRSGVITGKYLKGGSPQILGISVPAKPEVTLDEYVVDGSVKGIPEKSSDTAIFFSLDLGKNPMPPGTKLTFQVSRTSLDTGSSDAPSTAVPGELKSNPYVYVVSYMSAPPTPSITDLRIDNDSEATVWQTPGKHSGTIKGTNLTAGIISVPSLQIAGAPAVTSDYISSIAEVPKTSDAEQLDFVLTLVKAVPVGSKLSFVVATSESGTTLKTSYGYTVPNPEKVKQAPSSKSGVRKRPSGATTSHHHTGKK